MYASIKYVFLNIALVPNNNILICISTICNVFDTYFIYFSKSVMYNKSKVTSPKYEKNGDKGEKL